MLNTVLKTKLLPPTLPRHFVLREPLINQLNEILNRRLGVVTAPAGYGKSVLVSSWFRSDQSPECQRVWLTIDDDDNDPVRLIRNLGEAIELAGVKLESAFLTLLNSGQSLPQQDLANLLINQLVRHREHLVIVLDDVHRLTATAGLTIVDYLVRHSPERVHFLLAGREVQISQVSQLRLQGSLLELQPEDLCFGVEETESYFSSFDEIKLSSTQLKNLLSLTEGWVGGMQLVSINLAKSSDVDDVLKSMSGSSRNIAEFLLAEVISKLAPEVVDFMVRVSVLDRFNVDCCRFITGNDNAGELLESLERHNLFLFPLDEHRNWYRLHQLLSDFLRRRAQLTLRDELPALHRSAAEWFMQKELIEDALKHFFEAGEFEFAAELMDAHAKQLMAHGAGNKLIQGADRLPEKLLLRAPNLQLERAYFFTLQWKFEQAGKILKAIRRALGDPQITDIWEDRGHSLEAIYRDLIHHEAQLELLTDNMPEALRLSEEWLDIAKEDADSFSIAVTETTRIFAQRESFRKVDLHPVPAIRELFTANNALWGRVWHDTIIGVTHFALGNLTQAQQQFETALSTAHKVVGRASPLAAMAACQLAEVLYEQNDVDRAERLLEVSLPLAGQIGLMDQLVAGYITACRIARLRGQSPEKSLQLLNEAEEIGLRVNFQRLLTHVTLERIRLYLSLGDIGSALQVARLEGISGGATAFKPQAILNTTQLLRAIAWSTLNLAQNKQLGEVINVLELWIKHLDSIGRHQSLLRALLLLAVACKLKGDLRKAQRAVRKALSLGVYEGFIRSFVDAGEPILSLLLPFPEDPSSEDRLATYREKILAASGKKVILADVAIESTEGVNETIVTESLTRREMELLLLVARGFSNDQVANELGLTVGTVKWNLHQIFLKLGVSRRAQAVHRARELGFIH